MNPRRFTRRFPSPIALLLIAAFLIFIGIAIGFGYGRSHGVIQASLVSPTNLQSPPPQLDTPPWSIATYNVRNFFDTLDNPYTADEGTRPKSPSEIASLADAITQLNADVLVMQEVEIGGILKQFNQSHLSDLHYSNVVDETTEDSRGIGLGILSRFPITRIVSHRLTSLEDSAPPTAANRFARDLLRVDIQLTPTYEVTLYGVHLKSKLATDPTENTTTRRLAEATRIRQIITQEMTTEAHGRFILLGDCNDNPGTAPITLLSQIGTPPLVDTLAYLPAADRLTFFSPQFKEAVDYLWLSPELAPFALAPGAEILHGGPYEKASDHRPVRLRLHLPVAN